MHRTIGLRRYDVVVVGGGLTGCLVAGRLAMDNRRVALLEEGEDIRCKPQWHRSLACSLYAHRFADRGYESHKNVTVPQRTHRESDSLAPVMIPTPRVLGGGGVMGGRSWLIGNESDWAESPWNFRSDLLPRVQRLENVENAEPHRGRRGKFTISRPQAQSPLFRTFCEAMSKDTALTSEFNNKSFKVRAGCGRSESLIDPRTGAAHNTLQGYLMDAVKLRRPLDVICGARVFSINSRQGDKKTATGVSYTLKGVTTHVEADNVVLCAGGLGTPLLVSESRSALSVLPSFGTNFWDVPQVTMQFSTPTSLSHNCFMDPLVQKFLWLNVTCGTPISALCSAYDDMFCYWSSVEGGSPDVRFVFQPFTLNNDGTRPKGVAHGVQIIAQLLRPKSRGSIRDDGAIDPRYLTHPDDAAALNRAVERVKELLNMLPFSRFLSEMVAERFESAGVCGGTSYPALDPETFLLKNMRNVYVCDGSILPSPLAGTSLPYLLALGESFTDRFVKNFSFGVDGTAVKEDSRSTRIIY